MTTSNKRPVSLYFTAIILVAACFILSPPLTGQALASQDSSVATRLLGKPMEEVSRHFDEVRNRPSQQASLAKTFDERDYYKKGAAASLGDGEDTSMFIDMRHDIDQETETWHGSAGVQILF